MVLHELLIGKKILANFVNSTTYMNNYTLGWLNIINRNFTFDSEKYQNWQKLKYKE